MLLAVATLPAVAVPAAGVEPAPCQWEATALPLPPGITTGYVVGSDGGDVLVGLGAERSGATRQAILWTDGVPRLLGPERGNIRVRDVNTAGVVVGHLSESYESKPVRYVNGQWENLPLPPGVDYAAAAGINSAGTIVGYGGGDRGSVIIWPGRDPAGYWVLDVPSGDEPWDAQIDDEGRILAQTLGTEGFKSFAWNGVRTQLATGGSPDDVALANVIRGGRIAGRLGLGGGAEWDFSGRVVRKYPGVASLRDINPRGMAVGAVQLADRQEHGSVWAGEAPPVLLTAPDGTSRTTAQVISDDGVVSGGYRPGDLQFGLPARWRCT